MRDLYANTTSPKEVIENMLHNRSISKEEFAKNMDFSKCDLLEFMYGLNRITENIGKKLEKVMGISLDFWLKLDALYWFDLMRTAKSNYILCDEVIRKEVETECNSIEVKHNDY